MTTVSLEKDKISLQTLAQLAQQEVVIVTKDDKPVFAFMPVSEDDVQTWQLGQNPEFLSLMEHSWQRAQSEGTMSLDEARRQLLSD
jgi:hypothetical protein